MNWIHHLTFRGPGSSHCPDLPAPGEPLQWLRHWEEQEDELQLIDEVSIHCVPALSLGMCWGLLTLLGVKTVQPLFSSGPGSGRRKIAHTHTNACGSK